MKVVVPRELASGETRVAATPRTVKRMDRAGLVVHVESGAGDASGITDAEFTEAGATVIEDRAALFAGSEIILCVKPPAPETITQIPSGAVLIAVLDPLIEHEVVAQLADRGVNSSTHGHVASDAAIAEELKARFALHPPAKRAPQTKARVNTHHGEAPNRNPTAMAQNPLTVMAPMVSVVRPIRSASSPPAMQPMAPPTPMMVNVAARAQNAASSAIAARKLASRNTPSQAHMA